MPTASSAVQRAQNVTVPNKLSAPVVELGSDPVNPMEAVTKQYADALEQGLDYKDSVVAATTANVSNLSEAPMTIDGVSLSVGDRVLLKDQTTATENGIYVVDALVDPDTDGTDDATSLVRAADADEDAEVTGGMFCFVEAGTDNVGDAYVLSGTGLTLGTDDLNFIQFSSIDELVAGAGLVKNGETLELNIPAAAQNLTLTENGYDIEVVFDAPGDTSNVEEYEVFRKYNGKLEQVAKLKDADVSTTATVVDDEVPANVQLTYFVASVNVQGVKGSVISETVTPSTTVADPSDVKAVIPPNGDYYVVGYEAPIDIAKCKEIVVKVDAKADQGNLAEGDAVECYRGDSKETVIYEVADGEENYYHQFWVSSVTKTS